MTVQHEGVSEIEEYDVILDDLGRKYKMCKTDCPCHEENVRYDQIECMCPHYCGDEIID